ncbi:hypothetical protein GCM10009733_079980 [Nonomuraea maheshkhaliensis]|uniref:Uncharacterized protein n=1 Tax=Nonomuraea maheshkhaliensis TaxID=419590 RepID=A0ABP4SE16_9ACTN
MPGPASEPAGPEPASEPVLGVRRLAEHPLLRRRMPGPVSSSGPFFGLGVGSSGRVLRGCVLLGAQAAGRGWREFWAVPGPLGSPAGFQSLLGRIWPCWGARPTFKGTLEAGMIARDGERKRSAGAGTAPPG